jgi:hypothetical protein
MNALMTVAILHLQQWSNRRTTEELQKRYAVFFRNYARTTCPERGRLSADTNTIAGVSPNETGVFFLNFPLPEKPLHVRACTQEKSRLKKVDLSGHPKWTLLQIYPGPSIYLSKHFW